MRRYTHIFLVFLFSIICGNHAFSQTINAGTYTGAQFLSKVSGGAIKLNGNVVITSVISVTSNLTIDMNGYVIEGRTSNEAVISTNGGNLTIKNTYTGTPRSYTLTLYNGATKAVTGAIITNKNGRGLVVRNTCTISDCKIMGCNCQASGGGINIYTNGVLTMTDCEISYNYANNSGGGIHGRRFTLTNCIISNNLVGSGGADVYQGRGGGLYVVESEAVCTLNNCTITRNFAPREGGGIFGFSSMNINNSVISYNYAITQDASKNWGRGGGFYFGREKSASRIPKINLNATRVEYNAAMHFGGGGQVGRMSSNDKSELTLTNNSKICHNESILYGAGGLHFTGGTVFNFNSGEISYNTARRLGGGIHSSRVCTLNLNGGVIKENTVYGRGGGINLSVGTTVLLNGTDIINNRTYTGYSYNSSTITYNFVNGTCTWTSPSYTDSTPILGYGGGLAVDAGTCTVGNNSEITGNVSSAHGGGIALVMIDVQEASLVPKLTMDSGKISSNQTSGNGGGVYMMKNTSGKAGNISATINGGELTGNKSVANGGGVFLDTGSEFVMADGVNLSQNQAGINGGSGSGGAVYISQGTATINGGNILENKASVNGGALYVNGNVTVAKGNLNNNEATSNGGALYVQTGTVTMNNVEMNTNKAASHGGGLYLGNGSLSLGAAASNSIKNNVASNGAGVCIANGTLDINNCTVSGNTASNYGGGLYVANTSSVTINLTGGGIFDGNKAFAGGGMAVGGPITLNFEGSLQNNTGTNGGGIYLLPKGSASSGATLNFMGGFIRNNVANGTTSATTGYHATATSVAGYGGGAFLEQGSTFKTTIASDAAFGFYGNRADVAADDIFANGNGTTVILPDITGMTLSEFSVPTSELYWVEDYATGDTRYTDGTNVITSAGYSAARYQDALAAGSHQIGKLEPSYYDSYKNKYICLALGYHLFYVKLQKLGLHAGDVAIFNISYKDNNNQTVLYRKIRFVGLGPDVPVNAVVALPPDTWTFTEDPVWSWKYEAMTPVVKSITTMDDVASPIVFTNVLKSDSGVKTKVHHETHVENRMRTL